MHRSRERELVAAEQDEAEGAGALSEGEGDTLAPMIADKVGTDEEITRGLLTVELIDDLGGSR